MTTIFLVRHARHAVVDRVLAGRMQGLHLSKEGQAQARRLARRFALERITAIQSSPRERARETAQPIAALTGLQTDLVEDIDEVDFGEWTGRSFQDLQSDARWQAWNTARDWASTPAGETMADVQARVLRHIERLRQSQPQGRVVLVTHAEVIRAALLHYLGLPLGAFDRIEISPASVTVLELGAIHNEVISLNEEAVAA